MDCGLRLPCSVLPSWCWLLPGRNPGRCRRPCMACCAKRAPETLFHSGLWEFGVAAPTRLQIPLCFPGQQIEQQPAKTAREFVSSWSCTGNRITTPGTQQADKAYAVRGRKRAGLPCLCMLLCFRSSGRSVSVSVLPWCRTSYQFVGSFQRSVVLLGAVRISSLESFLKRHQVGLSSVFLSTHVLRRAPGPFMAPLECLWLLLALHADWLGRLPLLSDAST